jgi:hypothetical protein
MNRAEIPALTASPIEVPLAGNVNPPMPTFDPDIQLKSLLTGTKRLCF